MEDAIKQFGNFKKVLLGLIPFSILTFGLVALASWQPLITAVVFAIVAAITLFTIKPVWGIYLFAALYPLVGLDIWVGSSNAALVDWVALFVIVGAGLNLLGKYLDTGQRPKIKDLPFIKSFIIFVLVALASLLVTDKLALSVQYIARPIIFMYLMWVALPVIFIKSEKTLLRVLWIFLIGGLVAAVGGVFSLVLMEQESFPRVIPLSLFGFAPWGDNHNLLAEIFVITIPIAGMLVAWQKKVQIQRWLIVSIIFTTLVLLGTLSRGAWLALMLQVIILLWVRYRTELRSMVKYGLVVMLILTPIFIWMASLLTSQVTTSSNAARFVLNDIAWAAYTDSPVIGQGIGQFVPLVDQDRWFKTKHGQPIDSHGVIQKVGAELGTLGLLAFGLMFASIFRQLKKIYNKVAHDHKWRLTMLGFIIIIASQLMYQLFNTSYYNPKLWLPIGLAFAAGSIAFNSIKKNQNQDV